MNADNVTIDFGGFAITGPGMASGTGHGIFIVGRKNVEIKNGTIRNFGYQGILENNFYRTTAGHMIEHMRVQDNVCKSFSGIQLNCYSHIKHD